MINRAGVLFLLISGVLLLAGVGCSSQEDRSAGALKFAQLSLVSQGHVFVVTDSLADVEYSGHVLRANNILALDFFKQLSFEERLAVRGLPVFVRSEGEILLVGLVGDRIKTDNEADIVLEVIPFI